MSLAIDIDQITAVLLPDGWHPVADESFDVDVYELVWQDKPVRRSSQDKPTTGFTFRQAGGGWLHGPLSSMLAVRTNTGPEEPDRPAPRARVTSPDAGADR